MVEQKERAEVSALDDARRGSHTQGYSCGWPSWAGIIQDIMNAELIMKVSKAKAVGKHRPI